MGVRGGVENGLLFAGKVSLSVFLKVVSLKSSEAPGAFSCTFAVASFCNLTTTSASIVEVHSGDRRRSGVGASLKRLTKLWCHR